MIIYNSEINFNTIKEKDIIKEINRTKKELQSYGMTNIEINNLTCDNIDLCSYDVEKVLLNISICEFLWYNKLHKEYYEFKDSLPKVFLYNNTARLSELEEARHYNTFLSAMALIVQKYGKEILDELDDTVDDAVKVGGFS